MSGGGGLVMLNWLYNVADQQRSIATVSVNSNAILNGLTKEKNVNFDLEKFNWLFSTEDGENNAFVLWANTKRGLVSIEQMLETNDFIIGNQDTGENNFQIKILQDILKVKSRIVFGYKNPNQALLNNEIDARLGTLIGVKVLNPSWLDKNNTEFVGLIQIGRKTRHRSIQHVPNIYEFVSDDFHRTILSFYDKQVKLARVFVAPPKMEKETVLMFVNAAKQLEKDKQYLEEAEKLRIGIDFIDYEQVNSLIKDIINVDRKILEYIKN